MLMKVFQESLVMTILTVVLYNSQFCLSVDTDYPSGQEVIISFPQHVCETRFSVMSLCLTIKIP